jgi:hypothetical protein
MEKEKAKKCLIGALVDVSGSMQDKYSMHSHSEIEVSKIQSIILYSIFCQAS